MVRIGLAGLVAALALAASACSGPSSGTGEEGTLKVAAPTPILTVDPHGPESAEESILTPLQHIFDPLVRKDGNKWVPVIAKSWGTPDDRTWVFRLRDGVEFQDGTPLQPADVKASLERLIELNGPLAPLFADVTEIDASKDGQLTIKTKQPVGTMLSAVSRIFVAPADRLDDKRFWQKPVGTGAFEVDEFVPGEHLRLSRNADYFLGAPKLAKLEFVEIPEVTSRLTALDTGEIDLTWNIPPDQIDQVRGNDQVTYKELDGYAYQMAWFNAKRKPFDDARVRRAMWHALDIDTIVEDLYGSAAKVAKAPIPQPVFGAPSLSPYEYDPDKAKRLLAEAGYPNGFKTSMQWATDPVLRQLAETMISHWKKIGVKVTQQEKERAQWIEDLNALKWDMNLQGNTVITGDADYTLGRLYMCSANRTGYCSKELDELLVSARTTLDQKERKRLYHEAAEHIWNQAVGIFPMDKLTNAGWRSRVSGFELEPVTQRFHRVSVTEE